MLEFGQRSETWTSTPITDVNGTVQLSAEDIRRQVDEYAGRAYKAGKAAKDVGGLPAGLTARCRPRAAAWLARLLPPSISLPGCPGGPASAGLEL